MFGSISLIILTQTPKRSLKIISWECWLNTQMNFALDYMHIEMNVGAGWVAKFDVKTIEEATHNRMARQTESSRRGLLI